MGKKVDVKMLHSLSDMQNVDYSESPVLDDIHNRLVKGRDTFAGIYELDVNAVSEISELDLEIKFYTEQLMKIANSFSEATGSIYLAASDSTQVASVVAERHEDLTNTIITVSEESGNVYKKIDSSQQSLTEIRKLSENTITMSEKMHNDMKQLTKIIDSMNEVIVSINAISSQTNLLSLNASIEAARAGEAGRGFAVVADEIRALADETKKLTDDMGSFVASVQTATEASSTSVENAIESLGEVNTRIKDVWALNEENQKHIAGITESISNLAAVSEEISSSMAEIESRANEIENSCEVLKNDAEAMKEIGNNCTKAVMPLESIEKGVDNILQKMGAMSVDAFYTLSKEELVRYIDGAIVAHKNWLVKLANIIENRVIVPIQIDGTKCKFGHFYYSIEFPSPELKEIWKEIGEKHKALHKMGEKAIAAVFADDIAKASQIHSEATELSKQLVSKLEYIRSAV